MSNYLSTDHDYILYSRIQTVLHCLYCMPAVMVSAQTQGVHLFRHRRLENSPFTMQNSPTNVR